MHTITATFQGSGSLPKNLTAVLLVFSWESGIEVMKPVSLTPADETDAWTDFVFDDMAAANDVNAYITNIAYDSSSLTIGYTIENAMWFEAFDPTPEQLGQMTLVKNEIPVPQDNSWDSPLVRQYTDAVQAGTPAGLAVYSIVADDSTKTDAGVTLGQAEKVSGETIDGAVYAVREYENPQLAADALNVEIPLRINVVYLYFDGTDNYMMNLMPEDWSAMTGMALRADAVRRHMTGTGAYLGAPAAAEASVSAGYCELTLTVSGGELPKTNGTTQYDVVVRDGDGNALLMDTYSLLDAHTIAASFYGTGELPDTLTAEVLLLNGAAAATLIPPITLAPDTSQP